MNLCRCENGHFYDADKYSLCPHCNVYSEPIMIEFDEQNNSLTTSGLLKKQYFKKGKEDEIFRKLTFWVFFTVIAGTLPIGFKWIVYLMLDQNFSYGDACSEIFFFDLILSADGMKELSKLYNNKKHTKLKVLLFSTVTIVMIILAVIYGILLFNENSDNKILQLNFIYQMSKILTGYCVIANLSIQLIGGAEDNE